MVKGTQKISLEPIKSKLLNRSYLNCGLAKEGQAYKLLITSIDPISICLKFNSKNLI